MCAESVTVYFWCVYMLKIQHSAQLLPYYCSALEFISETHLENYFPLYTVSPHPPSVPLTGYRIKPSAETL